jgi:predicted RNA-binding Zn-ribbon protein involved in translation (DUF1610 family)
MSQDEVDFCACPDFLYVSGKCSNCGKWIDDPKEFAKSQRRSENFQLLRDGECDCGIPSMNLNGICDKCFRKVTLVEPWKFSKSNSEEPSIVEKNHDQKEENLGQHIAFCTSCGRSIEASENFCGGCGKQIKVSKSFQQTSKEQIANLPSSDKRANGKVVIGILLILGLLLLLYPAISKGGSSGGDNSNSPVGDSEGRWVSKCRLVNVPNPEYPGDQVPLSERIGIPKFYAEQRCTDVYVP